MGKPQSMTERSHLAGYLADYDSQLLGRTLNPVERTLIDEVLIDFMLDEPGLASRCPKVDVRHAFDTRSTRVRHALDALLALHSDGDGATAARIADRAMQYVEKLGGRLARQECVNDIMREHLTMLTTERG